MSRRYPAILISDMLQCVDEMTQFIEGHTYATFAMDIKTLRAIFASALISGEAAQNIDESVQHQAQTIEWHKLNVMPNRWRTSILI